MSSTRDTARAAKSPRLDADLTRRSRLHRAPLAATTRGLIVAVVAAFSFGISGALVKPLLEAGWSPAAAVTVRALTGGIILLPFALVSMRGNWRALVRARGRVAVMAVIGVAGCQLAYFAAVERIPINTAILIEYMAPLLLVVWVWMTTRRIPRAVVFVGSVVALGGLVLIVSPGGAGSFDLLGLGFAALAAIGCAIYYVIAAKPSDGLPPVALAAFGLLGGGLALAAVGAVGVVPFTATFGTASVFGATVPWWVPLLVVGIVATALAYAASITATEMLGSRLASFAGLLEVVAAAFYAWLLLGESLTIVQLLGGVLILAGIAFVRSDRTDVPLEPLELITAPIALVRDATVSATTVPATTVPAKTAPAKTAPAKTAPAKTAPTATAPTTSAPTATVPVPSTRPSALGG
jgi:drug/metabolite transporter (DMT)-like permease